MKSAVALFLVLVFTQNSFGRGFNDLAMDRLSREMLHEKKELSGRWKSGQKWKGFLCQGEYSYDAKLKGALEDLEFKVAGEGEADVHAELVDLMADVAGSYKSSAVLCIPFALGVKLRVDRVSVFGSATLIDEGAISKIKVKVVSTKFGTIHFGSGLSPDVEKFITRLVNVAFNWVWDSGIGRWISDRISDEVNKDRKTPLQ